MSIDRYIWKENATECFTSNKVVQKSLYKDGKPMEIFKEYPVILLKNFDNRRKGDKAFKIGQIYNAKLLPSGQIMIVKGILAICSDARAGVDFDWA